MSAKVRWGLLGNGSIAQAFARGVGESESGQVVACASRSQTKADEFARAHGIAKAYGSYDALLADKALDAVYISTPHPFHAEWTIKALNAGKHVLCEKPIALNVHQLQAMAEAATLNGRILMEAFMYRCHPQTKRLYDLVREKVVGDVRVIQATFSFKAGFNAESRLFNNDLAGGGIMDVGCYCVSIARLIAGANAGKPTEAPGEVKGQAHIGQTGVDEWAVGTMKFSRGVLAQIATGVAANQDNTLRIFCDQGQIIVPNWFVANRGGSDRGHIEIRRNGKPPETVVIEAERSSFGYEADVFAEGVRTGKLPHPAADVADAMENMAAMDSWRRSCGVVFNQEKPDGYPKVTVAGSTLSKPAEAKIPTGTIGHLDKPVSRLVMGCDNQIWFPHAAVMFDDFFERGGNCFDTAHIYAGGSQEWLLGQWIKLRGVRNEVAVIVKGCHTPYNDPRSLTTQLHISLDRMGIGHADIYMMHRDNPSVPVGEFVDVLNRHVKEGRIKAFGGSNWSLDRVQEANDYASKHRLQGFSVVSNNFSLARMVDPVWGGCIAASDPASRAWLTQTQLSLLSWSSQARGFFLEGRAAPERRDDAELTRCWYSEDNFRRLQRAGELASRHGVRPINIALAYVLRQPFPTFALIGPRTLEETRTSLPGVDVMLTPEELKYLNLET
jgi:predicted dehydrogenase/aryl-alcohol dehydrogenase-like predicted oxidoreductase